MSLLAEILSSKIRAEFFRLLFGLDLLELHLREIERRSGFTIGTVRQEAEKLQRRGLLWKRIDGNRTYYRANTEHPLYPEIHSLVLKTVGLVDVLRERLNDADIQYAFIFGSLASGSVRAGSDIDLFVIGKTGLRELSIMLKGVTEELGRELNIQVMTLAEFRKRSGAGEHFVSSVLSSPKLMVIGKEHELTDVA